MLEVGRKVVVRDGAKIIFIGELISVTNCRFAHQISDNSIIWNDVRIASIDGNKTPAGTGTFWGPRERKEFLAEDVSHPGPAEEQAATSPALTLGQIGEQIVADCAVRHDAGHMTAFVEYIADEPMTPWQKSLIEGGLIDGRISLNDLRQRGKFTFDEWARRYGLLRVQPGDLITDKPVAAEGARRAWGRIVGDAISDLPLIVWRKDAKKPTPRSFKNLGVHLMSINDGFAGNGKTTWIGYAVLAFVCAVVAFSIAAWAA